MTMIDYKDIVMPGILQLPMQTPGLVGVYPNPKFLVTSDNLSTITASGYLNQVNLESNPISTTDVLQVLYSFNQQSQVGIYGVFTVSLSGSGIITLTEWINPGNVLLPVVSGNIAVFNGTLGQIKDSGASPTNPAKTKVVMLNAAPTINHVSIFTSADGTIGDGGVLGTAAAKAASDNTKSTLASINAAPTINHAAIFTDIVGTIGDGGVLGTAASKAASDNTKAALASINAATTANRIAVFSDTSGTIGNLTKANGTESANVVTASGQAGVITTSSLTTAGGANYVITWTNTFIVSTSIILLTIMGGTNTTENITLIATAGSGTSTLTIFNNTAATALNGTIFIGYQIL